MARKSSGVNLEKSTGWYRACVNGKRYRLSKNKREAEQLHRQLLADADKPGAGPAVSRHKKITVGECCRKFIRHMQRNSKPTTWKWYLGNLESFESAAGSKTKADDLILANLTEWIDERFFSPTSSRRYSPNTILGAKRAVKKCFEWCEEQGWIAKSAFSSAELGSYVPCRKHVTDDEFKAILNHWEHDQDFCDLLLFLRLSGARVQEARVIEKDQVDIVRRKVVLENKVNARSSTRTRKRTIVLNDKCAEIVARQMEKNPDGPIFRNEDSNAWTASAIRGRLRRIESALGFRVTAKNLRHSWATEYLMAGGDLTTGAELMGHANKRMMQETYQHLADNAPHMQGEAGRVSGAQFA